MTKPNKNNIDEEFAELLDLAFPVNTDVALFDGDSRGLRERFTDFLKQKLHQVVANERERIVDEFALMQHYTGGSSVEPKDLRINLKKAVDIVKIIKN